MIQNYSEFKVYFVCMSLYMWFSTTFFGEWKMLMFNLFFSSWNMLTLRVSQIDHVVLAWSGFAALTFLQSSKQLFIDRDSPCQSMKMCKLCYSHISPTNWRQLLSFIHKTLFHYRSQSRDGRVWRSLINSVYFYGFLTGSRQRTFTWNISQSLFSSESFLSQWLTYM